MMGSGQERPLFATQKSEASTSETGSNAGFGEGEALLKQLTLQLPQFCCGCGIRLQRIQPEEPGYFIVPAKLLMPATDKADARSAPGAGASTSAPEQGSDGGYQDARAQLNSEAAAFMEERRRSSGDGEAAQAELPAVLCQRCYSLTHTGKIKNEAAESMLPEFDLAKKVGRKIALQKDRRAVVLCVVDIWDFDGSLPRKALQSLFPPAGAVGSPQAGEEVRFKLMIAVNKFDLLPKEATMMRVSAWVRTRLASAGLPKPEAVFMVSAVKMLGIRDMVDDIKSGLGFRGDLWVVGAQNAGKSSLIAAMKKIGGTGGQRDPTIAAMPGTTLNLLNVPGLPLGPKNRAFDTPGVTHPHQVTAFLAPEEVRQILPSKPLKGRTFRIGAGNTLCIGGLVRLDIVDAPGSSIYLTIFVSHDVDLHERLLQLPGLQPRELTVLGNSWQRSSVDIAIAGLGWVAIGCDGASEFKVWTYPGVGVTKHDALIPDFADIFERPGFSNLLSKAPVSAAETGEEGGGVSSGQRQPSRRPLRKH
ncbi:MAG: hypothetical protein WDW36_004821 [Sanguina aurantia]